jgi:myo-inositol-1(or 4)-monophosphatase
LSADESRVDPVRGLLVRATLAGGRVAAAGFGSDFEVRFKTDSHNLVTEYDRRAEEAIAAVIRESRPDDAIVAEEGSLGGSDPGRRWLVDPIDGTTNFSHAFPYVAVSVAYEVGGAIVLGAVYDPTRDELFVAERGRGAELNGRPISVSRTWRMDASLVSTGFPYERDLVPVALAQMERMVHAAQSVRRLGAAALELAYVACGRLDAFWEVRLEPWDCAAGSLLVEEAGGRVSDLSGRPFSVADGRTLATNGRIHDQVVSVLSGA